MAALWTGMGCIVGSLVTAFAMTAALAGDVADARREVSEMREAAVLITDAVDELSDLLSGLHVSARGGEARQWVIIEASGKSEREAINENARLILISEGLIDGNTTNSSGRDEQRDAVLVGDGDSADPSGTGSGASGEGPGPGSGGLR